MTNLLQKTGVIMKKQMACLTLFLLIGNINIASAQEIYVNQLGYFPSSEKYALIEEPVSGNNIAQILSADTGSTMTSATVEPAQIDNFSKQRVSKINFSSLSIPGKYLIKYNGKSSYPFEISDTVYDNALYQTSRSYFLQSCGIEVNDYVSGMYHSACHLQDGHIKRGDNYNATDKLIDAKGGWHDAGDYGKYIASTSTTTALLMAAYELSPEIIGKKLDLPVGSASMPDILEEIKYALVWMLKQQRSDGAVYRKCSGEKWPSDTTLPQFDTQKRFVYGISTQDTGRFSATMALAARVYKNVDPTFAKRCLDAAKLSWNYINTHGYYVDYNNTDDSGSGGYPNPSYDTEPYAYSDLDDKIWAASELYLCTKDEKYLSFLKDKILKIPYESFSWKNTTFKAVWDLALKDIPDKAFQNQLRQKLIDNANKIINKMSSNPYSIPMEKFIWGSNANVLGEGITLAFAYELTKNETYKTFAQKTLNYIFGCNPMNKSYVTGLGSNPAKSIHYRYTMSAGTVLPGFMVGGPNNTANDNVAKPGLNIKSYIDNAHSYATNEYAIDYNAPLVFMLNWSIKNNK